MAIPGGYDEDLDPMCDEPIDGMLHLCPNCEQPCGCDGIECLCCVPDDDGYEGPEFDLDDYDNAL